ncbi:MAG TPA: hypothetical protein VK506_06325 [Conexibacter sp.]|nr:hypothetical protein [Conexibacter sp.]
MGRRSRQRASAPPRESVRATAAPVSRSRRDDAPLPPWGAFPLVELAALAAIVCGVVGLVTGGRLGGVLLTVAMLLGSVAGLEVAIREHLAGYRSHTLILSGVLTVVTLTLLAFTGTNRTVLIPVVLFVLVTAILAFRQLFKHRSGGLGMRVR